MGKPAAGRLTANRRLAAVAAAAVAATIVAAFLVTQPRAGVDGPLPSPPGPSIPTTSSQSPSSPGLPPPSSPSGVPGDPIRLIGSTIPVGAAALWPDVTFPVAPSAGRSIAQAGSVIVEAGLQGSTLVLAHSSDSGATWTSNHVGVA